jgi:hypothetical protein
MSNTDKQLPPGLGQRTKSGDFVDATTGQLQRFTVGEASDPDYHSRPAVVVAPAQPAVVVAPAQAAPPVGWAAVLRQHQAQRIDCDLASLDYFLRRGELVPEQRLALDAEIEAAIASTSPTIRAELEARSGVVYRSGSPKSPPAVLLDVPVHEQRRPFIEWDRFEHAVFSVAAAAAILASPENPHNELRRRRAELTHEYEEAIRAEAAKAERIARGEGGGNRFHLERERNAAWDRLSRAAKVAAVAACAPDAKVDALGALARAHEDDAKAGGMGLSMPSNWKPADAATQPRMWGCATVGDGGVWGGSGRVGG